MLRAKAFGDAARQAGCTCAFFMPEHPDHPGYLSQLDPRPCRDWTDAAALRRWIAALPRPVGIMGCHDQRAFHVLEACQDLGLNVPEEVAILGVDDNLMLCESRLPQLSSIDLGAVQIGYEAAAMLDRMLAGEPLAEKHVVVPARGVIKRASSDVLAARNKELARAMAFIGEHFTEPIAIDDVAHAAGVSRSSVCRSFRQILGCSVAEEIRRRRLQRAKDLLRDPALTLGDVAHAAGFLHASHLVNFFASKVGMSPTAWRKTQKGER
jgi:LacI family transcriptional regulator